MFGGEAMIGIAAGNIPLRCIAGQSDSIAKAGDGVEHVLSGCRRNAAIDEPAVQFFAARGVKADTDFCAHRTAQKIRPQRQLTLQQDIEASSAQVLAQLLPRCPSGFLVDDDELNARDIADQTVLEATDDPSDAGVWPELLHPAHQGQNVGDIAECRQPKDAKGGRGGRTHTRRGLEWMRQTYRKPAPRKIPMDTKTDCTAEEGLIYDASSWASEQARAAFGADQHIAVAQAGRGEVRILQLGFAEAVLRAYRRGGLIAQISRDRYFWRDAEATRPFREFRLTAQMHAAGLPVPRPLAARYTRCGWGYRAELITERVAASATLADQLKRGEAIDWSAVGRMIASVHRLGVWHADLNATNILLDANQKIWLIDLDRGRMRHPSRVWQQSNLSRLLRSLRKMGAVRWLPHFETREWPTLLETHQKMMDAP